MAKLTGKLTDLEIRRQAEPGRYGDGGGLWFQVRKPDADKVKPATIGGRSWLLRYTVNGAQRQLGLGPYPDIGLAEARDLAQAQRRKLRDGVDPIAEKREREAAAKVQQAAMSFDAVLKLYLAAHEDTWKNPKHRQQWKNTLETYAAPVFGKWLVQAVDTGAVMKVIEPLWKDKTETASRLRGRIETILDYATARGWRTGENPARWKGHVENLLPKRSKVSKVEHHAALPWGGMGAFMSRLLDQPGTGALALRFTIQTAARTGETIGAIWSEIDLEAKVWTVPAERMKAGVIHKVPLSAAAMDVLRLVMPARPAKGDGYVFPGRGKDAGLSNMSLSAVLRRMDLPDLTVHGFRSSFRDWASEATDHNSAVVEMALAHTVGNKVEAAYRRGDLFEKRRELMTDWAAFCANASKKPEQPNTISRAA